VELSRAIMARHGHGSLATGTPGAQAAGDTMTVAAKFVEIAYEPRPQEARPLHHRRRRHVGDASCNIPNALHCLHRFEKSACESAIGRQPVPAKVDQAHVLEMGGKDHHRG